MTPEGVRILRHNVQAAVREASAHIAREARRRGTAAVMDMYRLDDYEYQCALDGAMPVETALRVLEAVNVMDAAVRLGVPDAVSA
jgi:hypothetical protein